MSATDIIGIQHYRSFLDLSAIPGNKERDHATFEHRYGYTQGQMDNALRSAFPVDSNGKRTGTKPGVDAIVVEPLSFAGLSLYAQFDACHLLAENLFKEARAILSNSKYEDMVPRFDSHFYQSSQKGFYQCLQVSSWKFFDAYCEFLFFMLDSLYTKLNEEIHAYPSIKMANPGHDSRYRLLAFFAERLASLFIVDCIETKKFNIGVAPRQHYTDLNKLIPDIYPEKSITLKKQEYKLRPLLRTWNKDTGDHMTITSLDDYDHLPGGYVIEGPLGYIAAKKVSSTDSFSIYRCKNSAGFHRCTKSPGSDGYTEDKTLIGYAFSDRHPKDQFLHLEEYRISTSPSMFVTSINPDEFRGKDYLTENLMYVHDVHFNESQYNSSSH